MTASELKRTTIIYLDVPVSIRDQVLLKEPHINKICPLCRGEINAGDKVKFLVNNYVVFPNVFVHDICFTQREPEEVIEWLHKDFQDFNRVMEMYKCWR